MKTVVLISLFFLVTCTAHAQEDASPRVRNLFLKAEAYKNHFDYSSAIENYKRFLTYKNGNYDAIINIADCYFKIKDYDQALLWYDSALTDKNLLPPHSFQYANTLLNLGETERARTWLSNYIQMHPNDKQAKEKLDGLENRDNFFKDSSRYVITNLPINSEKPEFSPALYKDGIILVSNGGKTKSKSHSLNTGAYLDLYYYNLKSSDSSTIIEPLNSPINSKLHEGPATFYDQDTKMIFTRNNKTKKGKWNTVDIIYFQLFYSEKNEKGEWDEPHLLSINDKEYSMGHPSITKDGKVLYFSSNIPGGFGGSDIYKSLWKDNTWSKPENLGDQINTSGNEMFPYIFNDSLLHFASEGFKGLGGLDIYKANIIEFNGVFNLGYPINTNGDDFSIAIYPDGNKGFFASNRDGGQGNDDLYEFIVKPEVLTQEQPSEQLQSKPDSISAVFYTVQILALKNPKLVNRVFMKKLKGVIRHIGKDGLYRYTYGEYQGAEDALAMLMVIKDMGYNDAFIRRVEKYVELSKSVGEDTDLLYEKMGRLK